MTSTSTATKTSQTLVFAAFARMLGFFSGTSSAVPSIRALVEHAGISNVFWIFDVSRRRRAVMEHQGKHMKTACQVWANVGMQDCVFPQIQTHAFLSGQEDLHRE